MCVGIRPILIYFSLFSKNKKEGVWVFAIILFSYRVTGFSSILYCSYPSSFIICSFRNDVTNASVLILLFLKRVDDLVFTLNDLVQENDVVL
jgi:hypothetical protein